MDTRLPTEELDGDGFVLRLMREQDAPRLRELVSTEHVSPWWGAMDERFPLEDEPEATRYVVWVGGQVAGMVQYGEEKEPEYRHAWIDVFLDAAHSGRGLGAAVVRRLARHLIDDRGHHRVTIDPALANEPAVHCYEKAGFQRVGVMRSAWRNPAGEWSDLLLMELVELS
jgi:aminoglycoside 6'-N-acetyltransferase